MSMADAFVYMASDTSFHVLLHGGPRFRTRVQSRDGARLASAPGDPLVVLIPAAAVRVLED